MSDALFSREEILGGLPAKRASALLFLIESRTTQLMAQSRQAMEIYLTEREAQERELAFIEAFALGREPPLRPTIQALERYAPQWASLVPENPRLRAALAHLIGQKYTFAAEQAPGMRSSLGLDTAAVQQAYERLYHVPLATIYVPSTTLASRLRWAWNALTGWLENLSPFWTAYALTLTETVGINILALPIAVAGVGPLAGIVLLLVFGIVNQLTIAYMAEAVTRSGTIRYGSAYTGRMVTDYLGRSGAFILTLGIYVLCFLALQACYIGFATTLEDITRVSALVWVAVLFLIGIYFLRRESLDATVASALIVGAINIGMILTLSLLSLTHLRLTNLLYVNLPFLGGGTFDSGLLGLVFGVIAAAYFGHLSVSNCGQVVLRRDPSGHSLVWGCVAAQVTALFLYCLWVLAVNGALAPQTLVGEMGTVLSPLAAEIGPVVYVLGSVLLVLGMGMGSIHSVLSLFNLTREWLPVRAQQVVLLPRRQGQLRFQERTETTSGSGLRLGLTFLGLHLGKPHIRLEAELDGKTQRVEATPADQWEIIDANGQAPMLDRLPGLRKRQVQLTLEILEASQAAVRLRVATSMRMTYEGEWDASGLSLGELLTFPDAVAPAVDDPESLPEGEILRWMMRQGQVSLAEVAAYTGQHEGDARTLLASLVDQGFVGELHGQGAAGELYYQVRMAPKRGRRLTQRIWQAMDDKGSEAKDEKPGLPRKAPFAWLLDEQNAERTRFWLGISPVVIAFLLTEWLLWMGIQSFSGLLSFIGIIVVSLLGGIFPVLLLRSSRHKGEYVPTAVYRFLGHPLLLGGIYLLFLASIFLHGLVIWQAPLLRIGASVLGVIILIATFGMLRRGAFARRLIVELRKDQGKHDQAVFAVTASGKLANADVQLAYAEGEQQYQAASGEVPAFSSLRQASFVTTGADHSTPPPQELKVWAHKITTAGDSESLRAVAEVACGEEIRRFDLKLSGGQVVLPIQDGPCRLSIILDHEA